MNRVGQALSDADQSLYDQMMQAGVSSSAAAVIPASYSTGTPTTPTTASSALSPTTLLIGGVVAIGLLYFLVKK